ncbi:cytochrome P450 [Monoraphidium neglectum]|uniref:Cytochrome P450 n=1 Tax=Monoraphidium neglectum TaxID=145388 RepID=A0A0D2JKP0_9CHLO|nr:cytochrome P450 [Monoraphidium neglectum]KIY99832.1 cytochrome P450 [Monoraphidium neglectum]|eukprot:XP_013898852.1 cytochrome P450 [Monoraphidium neglectum]
MEPPSRRSLSQAPASPSPAGGADDAARAAAAAAGSDTPEGAVAAAGLAYSAGPAADATTAAGADAAAAGQNQEGGDDQPPSPLAFPLAVISFGHTLKSSLVGSFLSAIGGFLPRAPGLQMFGLPATSEPPADATKTDVGPADTNATLAAQNAAPGAGAPAAPRMALVDTTTDTGAEATNSPNTGAAAGPTPQARGPLALPAMQGAPGPGPTPELGESGSDDGYGVDDDAALSAPAVVAGAPYASLADALASVPEFGAMSGAVAALGLADALRNPQLKATLFVPTDAAFRDAAARVGVSFAQLQQRYPRPMVQLVLFYHMVRNEAVRAPLPARALPTYNLGESLQGKGMRVKGSQALAWRVIAARLWCSRRIPGPPPAHWLLGHLPVLLSRPGESFRLFGEWDKAHGPVWTVRFMWNAVVVVSDPDLFGPLLRAGPRHLEKYLTPYKRLQHLIHPPTPSMLTRAEDEHWRRVKRAVVPAFQTANLRRAFDPMVTATLRVVGELRRHGESPIEFDDVAQRLTIDIIGEFGFARQFGSYVLGSSQEPLEAVRRVTAAMQEMNNPLNRWLPWRKAPRDLRWWGKRLHSLVDRLLTDMEASPPPPHTLAAHVMAIRDAQGRPLSRRQMIAELALLWGAGFETTAHTLSWAIFLVSTHPAVEAAILEELGDLAAAPHRPTPRRLEWSDLARLRRLSAALQEAMRLYPAVATGTARVAHEDMEIGGHRLCRGMPVMVPTYAVMRSPRLWVRPDEFLPFERWLGDEGGGQAGGGLEEDARCGVGGEEMASGQGSSTGGGGGKGGSGPERRRSSRGDSGGRSGGGGDGGEGATRACEGPALAQPSAFLAFSQGTRSCVGQGLAVVELKAALALLLGHFSFDLAPGSTPEGVDAAAAQAITLRPGQGLWVVPRARNGLPGGRRPVENLG